MRDIIKICLADNRTTNHLQQFKCRQPLFGPTKSNRNDALNKKSEAGITCNIKYVDVI